MQWSALNYQGLAAFPVRAYRVDVEDFNHLLNTYKIANDLYEKERKQLGKMMQMIMSILETGSVLKTTDFDVHWFVDRQHFINPQAL
ncbi:hypothetical protein E4U59_004160 [Claviceps monticola]|nr:hypothetical protein E4U59_004160 [Claviceps monticola]